MAATDKNDAQPIRLTLEFNTASGMGTTYYALEAQTYRQLRIWQAQQKQQPTSQDLNAWLNKNGGKRDRADGPAVVVTRPDGYRREVWYRNGQFDRADGPAFVETRADGSSYEAWYRNGEFVKAETLANPATIPRGDHPLA